MAAGDIMLKLLISGEATSALASMFGLSKEALNLKNIMAGAGLAIAGVAIALGVEAVKAAGDFQAQTERLVTSAGELQGNLGLVRSGLLQMSIDTATSTDQLAQGMYYVESAGYHAAAGLQVMQAAAMGAKSENADLDVVAKALTTEMVDYHMSASQAADAMNGLIAAVQNGKTNLQDLASSMGAVLPIASSLGISFPQVAGAMDTMTNAGMSSRQAAMNLAHVLLSLSAPSAVAVKAMKEVGLSAQGVKDALVHQGLPEALQMIEDAVGKKFPPGSVAYEQAMKSITGGIMGVKLAAMLTGPSLDATQQNIKKIADAMNNGHGAVLGFAEVQSTLNFKMDQAGQAIHVLLITIGTQLIPIVSSVVGAITPVIGSIATWIGQGDHLKIVLVAVGGIIAALILPALWGVASAVIAATWPFLAIGAAIAGVVAIFLHFYNTNAGFRAFIDNMVNALKQLWTTITTNFIPALQQIGIWFQQHILPILQQIGAFLLSTFKPVWQQLVTVWNGQILPALKQLWAAIQPLMPIFKVLGIIIGGVVVVALILLAAILNGVLAGAIKAVAGLISGLATVIGGIVKVITGVVQVISGVVTFIVDLVTGHFNKLGGDLGRIWDGIKNIFGGVWDIIKGIFQAAIGAIIGLVGGFVQGFVGFFQALFPGVVSFIEGIWNDIASFFVGIWTSISDFTSSVWNSIVSFLSGIWNDIASVATSIWNGIVSVISNIWKGIVSVFSSVWNVILNILKVIWNVIKMAAFVIFSVIVAIIILPFVPLINFFKSHWAAIHALLMAVWNAIKQTATTVWNAIVAFFTTVWNAVSTFFTTVWNAIVSFLTTVWNGIASVATTIWTGISKFFQTEVRGWQIIISTVWNAITSFLSGVWNKIKGIASSVWNGIVSAIKGPIQTVMGWLSTAWDAIKQAFSNTMNALGGIAKSAWNGVSSVIKGAINGLIDIINHMIDGVNSVTGTIGIPSIPHIPHLAGGGMNLPAGMYWVGEMGPEILYIPQGASVLSNQQSTALVSRSGSYAVAGSRGGSGGGYDTANIVLTVDGRVLAQAVGVRLADGMRRQGGVRSR